MLAAVFTAASLLFWICVAAKRVMLAAESLNIGRSYFKRSQLVVLQAFAEVILMLKPLKR